MQQGKPAWDWKLDCGAGQALQPRHAELAEDGLPRAGLQHFREHARRDAPGRDQGTGARAHVPLARQPQWTPEAVAGALCPIWRSASCDHARDRRQSRASTGAIAEHRARRSACVSACCRHARVSVVHARRNTGALVTTTLRDGATMLRSSMRLEGERKDPFMLHYNFPPFSTGETGMLGTPEAAARSATARSRAVQSRPCFQHGGFPYVLRVVSE